MRWDRGYSNPEVEDRRGESFSGARSGGQAGNDCCAARDQQFADRVAASGRYEGIRGADVSGNRGCAGFAAQYGEEPFVHGVEATANAAAEV